MAPYLQTLLSSSPSILPPNAALLSKLKAANEAELTKFDAKLVEAEESQGETEVSDILRAKAAYLTKIGDKVGLVPDG